MIQSMGNPLLMGIDLGTTCIKVMVFQQNGVVMAQASASTPIHHPEPGRAHYLPEELWMHTVELIRNVLSQLERPQELVSVAVASVGEAGVALDAKHQPLGESIAWFDTRSAPQSKWLEEQVGRERLYAITGLHAESIYSLCKLLWIREHQPQVFEQMRCWLNLSDYIAFCLSGEEASERTQASRTLCLDLNNGQRSEEVLDAAGIAKELWAPLRPNGAALGQISKAAQEATGLPAHTVVGVGGHDHVIGAIAAGVAQPGQTLDSMGTAEAVFSLLPPTTPAAELRQLGYSLGMYEIGGVRGRYSLTGLYTSGASIDWFLGIINAQGSYKELTAEAERAPRGSRGACFMPHLRLAGAPDPDSRSGGAFIGLSTYHNRGMLFRALLEGLCYEHRRVLEPLLRYGGAPDPQYVQLIGGGAQNNLWLRIKASVLGRPLHVLHMSQFVCLGAAMLGGLAKGVYPNLDAALSVLPRQYDVVEPQAAAMEFYDSLYRDVYAKLYQCLRPLHHRLAAERELA